MKHVGLEYASSNAVDVKAPGMQLEITKENKNTICRRIKCSVWYFGQFDTDPGQFNNKRL